MCVEGPPENAPPIEWCYTQPGILGHCSCASEDNCATQMKFYEGGLLSWEDHNVSIPQLFSGCSVIESVRMSGLTCFFNSSCLNGIMKVLSQYANSTITTPILASNPGRYLLDTLMGTVIDNLMVDRWNDNVDYDRYYSRCKPLQCSYIVTTRGNLLYIFSTIVGIVGGLTTLLKLFSKIFVTIVRNRMRSSTGNATITGKSSEGSVPRLAFFEA
jgi:hypothetical protein